MPGGSQVILYLGQTAPEEMVRVPDFTGMNRQQAADAAGKLGLYVLVSGNDEIAGNIVAVAQDIPPGTQVSAGKTVQVTFADPAARD